MADFYQTDDIDIKIPSTSSSTKRAIVQSDRRGRTQRRPGHDWATRRAFWANPQINITAAPRRFRYCRSPPPSPRPTERSAFGNHAGADESFGLTGIALFRVIGYLPCRRAV